MLSFTRIFTILITIVYVFFFLRRSVLFFFPKAKRRSIMMILGGIALVCGVLRLNKWGLSEFLLWHFVAFAMLTDGIHLIVVYGLKKNNRIWQYIVHTWVLPILMMIALLIYAYLDMTTVLDIRYTITTDKSLRPEGYDIVLMSDIHFGTTMDIKKFETLCKRVSDAKPDLVVLCGDITDDNTTKAEMQSLFAAARKIQSEFGILYVYGNHDRQPYYPTKKFTPQELEDAITSAGITVLSDETLTINDEIVAIGREDLGGSLTRNRASIQELTTEVDTNKFLLVLDHQPKDVENCANAGCDLQLSGHTHGGQVWPKCLINGIRRDYYYGHETYKDYHIIISSGVGGWGYPFRTGSHSEIVTVHITGANE